MTVSIFLLVQVSFKKYRFHLKDWISKAAVLHCLDDVYSAVAETLLIMREEATRFV